MDKLIYDKPASKWNEAMPLGNGCLGVMVKGEPTKEVLYMNEDSLVAGGMLERMNTTGKSHLGEIRELLLNHKLEQVQKLVPRYFYSTIPQSQHYEPLGQVCIETEHKNIRSYKRMLDLSSATALVQYDHKQEHFIRECFVSYPDNVCVYILKSSQEHNVNFDLYLARRDNGFGKSDSYLTEIEGEGEEIYLHGHNGSSENGLSYTMAVSVQTTGGQVSRYGNRVIVENATDAVVYITGRTSYRTKDPRKWCHDTLECARKQSYSETKKKHEQDYRLYYGQMELKLGHCEDELQKLTIPERLRNIKNGKLDIDLLETFFNMGKYLLISSSREGSLPANLQGIWNESFSPYWGSRYTININTQMNYWMAEKTGLSSMHIPLMKLLKDMFPRGQKIARGLYGCRGTCAHHNTDIWGDCAPTDYYLPSSVWPLGFVWLCLHIFIHYQYTKDREFIEEYFPIIKENALFLLDYMFQNSNGEYETGPSVSPENTFQINESTEGAICMSPAMDIQIIREFFKCYLELTKSLDRDDLRKEVKLYLDHLPPIKIGRYGQIMEWSEDCEETDPGHRHISQLFGLYPGTQIRPEKTPDLAEAAQKTLDRRIKNGGGQGGWCSAWIALCYARLRQGESAFNVIEKMLKEYTYDSLLENFADVFQIDGNLGGANAILELLVQDFDNEIFLLPALPEQLESGRIKGMRLKAGATLDMEWTAGSVKHFTITAAESSKIRVNYNGMSETLNLIQGAKYQYPCI